MFGKITDAVKGFFVSKYIKSAIRHLLSGLGLTLLGLGIDPEAVKQFTESGNTVLTGLVAYGVAQLWSWLDKKKNQK